MENTGITPGVLDFLSELKTNNNRDWFEKHKPRFRKVQGQVKNFYNDIADRLREHDEIERVKLFRIYRDVRFSADKTPYKAHFAGSFSRAGAHLRGGYYLRIRPGESFAAVGFWDPRPPDLLRIRQELEQDASEFRECIEKPGFRQAWGNLKGDAVKTAPKGFGRDHPDIDLIRHKQFIFVRELSDGEVTDSAFADTLDGYYRAVRPWFDLMSQILTTNLNGESLLDQ
ncbi:DUF2461 domain-containing protein [Robiginitalea sp. SC105]|uniref:DUF2461 domain-containing protein n=1 Tax=Robiginitalea sp. SC105 TaxID=2762332 RepID=UPI00163A425C|nr:DUF2461 domain-containing protein [Robiginitalea sp. SC105]MBC2840585.1 DUF2461 domain-containing protein [Robiginitalea sp. SC105]